jgi:hypothetical protein
VFVAVAGLVLIALILSMINRGGLPLP